MLNDHINGVEDTTMKFEESREGNKEKYLYVHGHARTCVLVINSILRRKKKERCAMTTHARACEGASP